MAGAGGNLGRGAAARATPDGYTLVLVSSSYMVNPSLYPKVPYDQAKDFLPVTLPAYAPNVLVANPSLPIKSAKELAEFVKANSGKVGVLAPAGTPKEIVDLLHPGLPLPTILSDHELQEMVGAAVDSATSLTANQRVAAELLNDSFFKMSPEASFLLRVSAVEALCPQADQTDAFRGIVNSVLASIPRDAPRRPAGRTRGQI